MIFYWLSVQLARLGRWTDRHESGCAGAFYLFVIVAVFVAGFLARGVQLHWPGR